MRESCANCIKSIFAIKNIKNIMENIVQSKETSSFLKNDSGENDLKKEDCFLTRPVKNIYSNNDLYSMEIDEIYLRIHPIILKNKANNKYDKSFHPFFYLRLITEDEEDFRVVVQYIAMARDAKS